ncbi:pentapeptide repeat-containing protein, partial [Pacificibacter marinus]|uniref:pentapeptide repeat-containing protein n=2 Tax=Pacificibacter TaxID=1042323 RepID=UPI001C0A2D13
MEWATGGNYLSKRPGHEPLSDKEKQVLVARFENAGLCENDIPILDQAINLSGTIFPIKFTMKGFHLTPKNMLRVKNCLFIGDAMFSNIAPSQMNFSGTEFQQNAYFTNITIGGMFGENSHNFENAIFKKNAIFESSVLNSANFASASFEGTVDFQSTSFIGIPPDFRNTKVTGDVRFSLDYSKWPNPKDLSDRKSQNYRPHWIANCLTSAP